MLEVIRDLLLELAENKSKKGNKDIESRLLSLLRQNGSYSAKKLSLELGISERQVQRILRNLRIAGTIEHVGAKRNGQWIVY